MCSQNYTMYLFIFILHLFATHTHSFCKLCTFEHVGSSSTTAPLLPTTSRYFSFILLGKLSSLYPIVYCRELLHFAHDLIYNVKRTYVPVPVPSILKLKLFFVLVRRRCDVEVVIIITTNDAMNGLFIVLRRARSKWVFSSLQAIYFLEFHFLHPIK